MKYSLNLFGYALDCQLTFSNGQLHIEITEENQSALRAYLSRVLVKYGHELNKTDTLESLVERAIEVEKSMNGHLSEPKLKLPYEFQPEIKEKLIKAAELQDMSATQLLIRLIERKYQSVFEEEG
ncbi:hypothetical protein M5X00_24165 [Paenibacillus alvei]|uniref:Uncharacterized protein n=1 Tax=Paenibacillus alvei TaxID=44250 RepID=A0ABT4GRM5_PAEAL|nr:hypothetical protein [Paenibacillus alvei]MCY9757325.1 hypothetical protein [Paenibacillus alvei]MCY9759144.1 hypothetical protein [Paenibacillus alvei]MCY9770397.1 hypothetical protein [Paenibacillus alvei]